MGFAGDAPAPRFDFHAAQIGFAALEMNLVPDAYPTWSVVTAAVYFSFSLSAAGLSMCEHDAMHIL